MHATAHALLEAPIPQAINPRQLFTRVETPSLPSLNALPVGAAGQKMREEIIAKIEKWQEPPPAKTVKPLPKPDEHEVGDWSGSATCFEDSA
eukprot:1136170-Pelagomonas_calceolata.AAC.7